MVITVQDARQIAATVPDPELPMLTLHDLGVLRDVRVEGERVIVEITPTYSGCPAMAEMRADLAARLHVAGYRDVDVRTVLSPPWTSDDITDRGPPGAGRARHRAARPGAAARPRTGAAVADRGRRRWPARCAGRPTPSSSRSSAPRRASRCTAARPAASRSST